MKNGNIHYLHAKFDKLSCHKAAVKLIKMSHRPGVSLSGGTALVVEEGGGTGGGWGSSFGGFFPGSGAGGFFLRTLGPGGLLGINGACVCGGGEGGRGRGE